MRRNSTLTFAVAIWVVACSGSGTSGGCASLAPLATPYAGPKTDNAINLQISPEGVNYINNNWQQLINMFAPGGTLALELGCMSQAFNIPVLGNVTAYIADQGNSGADPGWQSGSCTAADVPVPINITVEKAALVPTQPDILNVSLTVRIKTSRIYVKAGCAECGLDFDTDRDPGPQNGSCVTNAANCAGLSASIKFAVDTKWDRLLSFSITQLNGSQVCGSSGSLPRPQCIDPGDVDLSSECNCSGLGCVPCETCSVICTVADWDPIKNFVLEQLSPLLQDQIKDVLAGQSCRTCGPGLPACPTAPGGGTSTCQSGQCIDTATTKCVPRFLGVEGRVNLGASMASFGVPANAALDLSIQAGGLNPDGGSSFSVDSVNALNIGTRGGLAAVAVAPCVPVSPPPQMIPLPVPNFRGEAPPISPTNPAYHMALGVSSPFLNLAFHQAQQGGVLCLQLSTATVGLINTGLFKTFLPSLGKLATRDGKDAPMMVVLRPSHPPVVKVGAGGSVPLLTVTLTDLTIDFYASIDDRFARLFSLTADITLPLSLTFSGCTSVTPAIGDLKQLITNIRTSNSEMLAEDPKVLADLIPAVVGLAEPALASALKPIDLPDLGAFKLKVNAGKGVGQIGTTANYNHLGLYATMLPIGAACATVAPRVTATLEKSLIPRADKMRATGAGLEWPTAVLKVSTAGVAGIGEFSTRIDDGLWSEFRPATASGELWVSHPIFLLQGLHKIEVRGRVAEDPHGIGEPIAVPFMIDWEPPEVAFSLDRQHDRLNLTARDVISPSAKLEYSYQVGDGAWSAYGPSRDIIFSAIEAQGGVTAHVRDEMGNVGEVAWRVPTFSTHPDTVLEEATPAEQRSGCAAVSGLPLVALIALVLRRRQKS